MPSIQMRRGRKADFDPWKMKQGEWAVTTDTTAGNQWIWMCFNPGTVHRIATYETFEMWLNEFKDDTTKELKDALNLYFQKLQTDTDSYFQGRIRDDWEPVLKSYVTQAQTSASSAAQSASSAATSETNAKSSQTAAKASETNAKTSETNAKTSETAAKTSETNAMNWAKLSESHSHGSTGVRSGENTDNAKYWSEQAAQSAASVQEKANWVWRSDYDPKATYQIHNLVEYNGCVWIAMKDNPQGTPQEDHVNWDLFAYGYSPEGRVEKIIHLQEILPASWSGSEKNWTVTLSIPNLSVDDSVYVYKQQNLTPAQRQAIDKADLDGPKRTTDNQLPLIARSKEKPDTLYLRIVVEK